MSRAITGAIVARLKADLAPKVTVYDGGVPAVPNKPALPYVVVYPDSGPRSRDRLTAVTTFTTLRVQLTSVGLVRENAQAVAEAARTALLDWRPTVSGMACSPVQQDDTFSAPIRRDDTVQPAAFYAIDQYLVTAVPA